MRKSLLLCCLLPLAAALPSAAAVQAGSDRPACVPVVVEAPQALPAVDSWRGSGCIEYRRAPAALAGADAQVLVFGDPQVKSDADVDYFRRDIVQPLQGRLPVRLGLTLGDLV
ncbi:MAG: hypothetical protein ACK4MU_04765, partial [Thermomonas sp.]